VSGRYIQPGGQADRRGDGSRATADGRRLTGDGQLVQVTGTGSWYG